MKHKTHVKGPHDIVEQAGNGCLAVAALEIAVSILTMPGDQLSSSSLGRSREKKDFVLLFPASFTSALTPFSHRAFTPSKAIIPPGKRSAMAHSRERTCSFSK